MNPVSVVVAVVVSQATPIGNATWSQKVGVASGCVLSVAMLCLEGQVLIKVCGGMSGVHHSDIRNVSG